MTAYPIYQVDAFADELFTGNPAAVCPLPFWPDDIILQKLALENNLSETAFIVKETDGFRIRWFTPSTEVKLCGHATLAAAHIFFTELNYSGDDIIFNSLSGTLSVSRVNNALQLDFPAHVPELLQHAPAGMLEGLGVANAMVFSTSFDYMVVLENEAAVRNLKPNFPMLARVKCRGIITTAPGDNADFVSRCFYPQSGINEDPVTGSAHTIMVPYWSKQLNKNRLSANQISERGGHLHCELKGDRVLMQGRAITYLKGSYFLPNN